MKFSCRAATGKEKATLSTRKKCGKRGKCRRLRLPTCVKGEKSEREEREKKEGPTTGASDKKAPFRQLKVRYSPCWGNQLKGRGPRADLYAYERKEGKRTVERSSKALYCRHKPKRRRTSHPRHSVAARGSAKGVAVDLRAYLKGGG